MKVLKKAEQKNIKLNNAYYTESQIKEMLDTDYLYFLDWEDSYENMYKHEFIDMETVYTIFTSDVKEIKVELDKYGYYTNVAILSNGLKLYVIL